MSLDVTIGSDDGYTMLVIEEEAKLNAQTGLSYARQRLAWKFRRFCRKSCVGKWGHSRTFPASVRTKNNRYIQVQRTYFAFEDETDRLASILKLGDQARIVQMWPTGTTFNIYTNR